MAEDRMTVGQNRPARSYYLILCRDLRYCDIEPLWSLSTEVRKLLYAYRKAIVGGATNG